MMNTKILELLVILLQTSYCLCHMRKTIKVEKLPFPSAGNYAANLSLNVGDQKEVTLCFKFRTFAYNEGSSSIFRINTECPLPEEQRCNDTFKWDIQIKWKSGRDED